MLRNIWWNIRYELSEINSTELPLVIILWGVLGYMVAVIIGGIF